MKNIGDALIRIGLFALVFLSWMWVLAQPFSNAINLGIIVGAVILVFPVVWLGRLLLDRDPDPEDAAWMTTLMHALLMVLFGAAIIRALSTLRILARLADTRSGGRGPGVGRHHRRGHHADGGEPGAARLRGAVRHCPQPPVGDRLAVCLDPQPHGPRHPGFAGVAGPVVPVRVVHPVGASVGHSGAAVLCEGVRGARARDPFRRTLPPLQGADTHAAAAQAEAAASPARRGPGRVPNPGLAGGRRPHRHEDGRTR